MPRIDLTDKAFDFGFWTVLNYEYSRRETCYWKCQCKCGTIKILDGRDLRIGDTKSCGCRANTNEDERKGYTTSDMSQILRLSLKNYKCSAKSRNLPFELTQKQFVKLVTQPCNYCGDPPRTKTMVIKFKVAVRNVTGEVSGIDRIDNLKGYTLENSRTCCWECNNIKKNWSEQKFRSKIEAIYTHWANPYPVIPVSASGKS